jgi:hypothetical protein
MKVHNPPPTPLSQGVPEGQAESGGKVRPNGEWEYCTRCHMPGRECPAVLPDRALYLPTCSHLQLVNNSPPSAPQKRERERE